VTHLLSLTDINVKYGTYQALSNISLQVKENELVVLLGSNGSGKSTIFRTISGLQRVASGEVSFHGSRVSGLSPNKIVRKGISQCPEGRKLFPQLTVRKNLLLGAYLHRRNKTFVQEGLEYVYTLFPILREKADQPAGSLSGGQQQMVAIGRALMAKPKLLLLDEPSLGLAPLVVQQMLDAIKQINRFGTSVLLAEQNAHAALQIADRGYILENGKIVLEGSQATLLNNPSVRQAYLGL
jgi:branched-chain amino acid transport system ATP-binding protein